MPTDEERPYRDLSERQIYDAINQLRRVYNERDRERQRYQRKPGYQTAAEEMWPLMQENLDDIKVYDKELDIRKDERRQRREAREQRETARSSRPASNNGGRDDRPQRPPGAEHRGRLAIGEWAARLTGQRAGHITTDYLTYTWQTGGRDYYGVFWPATGALNVWVRVAPGTPGAADIEGRSYLPANTPDDLKHAFG